MQKSDSRCDRSKNCSAPGLIAILSLSRLADSLCSAPAPFAFLLFREVLRSDLRTFFSFFHFWGNKKWEPPVKWRESWKNLVTQLAQQAANGLVWMPRILTPLRLIHFLMIPLISFYPHWGNQISEMGAPRWKFVCDIITGSKWSSLNAPDTETPVSHSFLGESPLLLLPSLG